LGNKHVYHVFGLDPFYWLVVFSVGTLYSNVFLTGLIFLFWGCVILYTFQETPRLNADDDSDSSSDESDSEIMEEDPRQGYQRRHSTARKSSSVPPGGTIEQQQQQQQQQQQHEGLRRRPTAMHPPENIDDEIKDMMLFS